MENRRYQVAVFEATDNWQTDALNSFLASLAPIDIVSVTSSACASHYKRANYITVVYKKMVKED